MALCLAVGLWTRIAAVGTWFLYVAMIQRNLMSFNGETGILAFTLLGLAFAPAPQRVSIDHLVLKRPLPTRTEMWPARFIQLNMCLMYFFTTLAKLLGSWDVGRGEIWYRITLSDWFGFPEWSGSGRLGSAGSACMGRSRWKAALPSLCGRDSAFRSSLQ